MSRIAAVLALLALLAPASPATTARSDLPRPYRLLVERDGGISVLADSCEERDDRVLAADGTEPAWSPDGRRVAFSRAEGQQDGTYIVGVEGGEPRRVATGRAPAWSPDGTRLAVTVAEATGPGQYEGGLVVVDLLTGEERPLGRTTGAFAPTWSPDGGRIAFYQAFGVEGYGGVGVVDLEGTTSRSTPAASRSSAARSGRRTAPRSPSG